MPGERLTWYHLLDCVKRFLKLLILLRFLYHRRVDSHVLIKQLIVVCWHLSYRSFYWWSVPGSRILQQICIREGRKISNCRDTFFDSCSYMVCYSQLLKSVFFNTVELNSLGRDSAGGYCIRETVVYEVRNCPWKRAVCVVDIVVCIEFSVTWTQCSWSV